MRCHKVLCGWRHAHAYLVLMVLSYKWHGRTDKHSFRLSFGSAEVTTHIAGDDKAFLFTVVGVTR